MRRVIVGTAGHIDHGKTKLIQALTGIDCDRWVEEKERGITIDLGFAVLREEGLQIGFIDVPGHERFVHNALAGLGGIRIVLLVVAADEGVKPQTREHLAICRLLRIPACLVALTKKDLASDDVLELARLEVEELIGSTPYADASIIPVSSKTGEGMSQLRRRLIELAEIHHVTLDPSQPARLPIDRAFHMKGLGVVVTGTLVSGTVKPGDSLQLLPHLKLARVRSVQVHGSERQLAERGERTALQLSGVTLDDLRRGVQLAATDRFQATTALVGSFTLLADVPKPVKGSTAVRVHLFSSDHPGRLRPLQQSISPGSTGLVEIRLSPAVLAARGDRFIVRRPSPAATLGGGEILDPNWRRRSGRLLADALAALSGDLGQTLTHWIRESQEVGITTSALARRLGREPRAIEQQLRDLASEQLILKVSSAAGNDSRWLEPKSFRRVAQRAERVLKDYFRRQRLAGGMRKAELVERILPRRARSLADIYLDWLEKQKALVVRGDVVNLPGRSAELTREESRLAKGIVAHFDATGLKPPSPNAVREELGTKAQIFEGVVQYLLEQGSLARLPGGLLISAAALGKVIDDLRGGAQERFTVGDFKTRYGLTRKWAIPILEHLDSAGVTRRVGDHRQVIRTRR